MFRRLLLLLLSSSSLSVALLAQATWDLGGTMRYRGEYDGLDFDEDTDGSTFSTLKTRVGLRFNPNDRALVFIQLQDSRTFGAAGTTANDGSADAFDMQQGYFKLIGFAGLPADLTVGRMEVSYGTERFMGVSGWGAYGRSFDGAILRLRGEEAWVDVFGFREAERLNDGNRGDRNVYGFWGQTPLRGHGAIHSFLLWQRATPSSALDRYTLGLTLPLEFGKFQPVLEGAWQMGREAGKDVSAYTAAGKLVYVLETPLLRSVAAGADVKSGNRPGDPNRIRAYTSVYGTGHRFFGFMDYFTSFPSHALGLGLTDYHATVVLQPHKTASIEAAFHRFVAHEPYRLSGGTESRLFGDELDITAQMEYNEHVIFTAGASVFWPGEIFKARRGDDLATWLYVMTTVRF